MPRAAAWAGALLLAALTSCSANPRGQAEPGSLASTSSCLAVTVESRGEIVLLDRRTLLPLRTLTPVRPGPAAAPMHVVEDRVRGVCYVGNFDGGLARVPLDGGPVAILDLGAPLIGLALSPDGHLLAVNGARDLTLRLVDLDAWRLAAEVRIGEAADEPRHSHMTHGLGSTHPTWLPDGSGVLTQDNVHEQVVLVGRDGRELARRELPCGVHAFVVTGSGEVLALAEGTVDGSVAPRVVVLAVPGLDVLRELIVPVGDDEAAKLHHGALSPDGATLVVANMGPMHGDRPGRTVAAVRWRTGEVAWHVACALRAGHVRFLDEAHVAVLGHSDSDIAILDAHDGHRVATRSVPGVQAWGHGFAAEANGSLLLLDSGTGRVLRLAADGSLQSSPPLGEGVAEASLPE